MERVVESRVAPDTNELAGAVQHVEAIATTTDDEQADVEMQVQVKDEPVDE